MAQDGAPPHQGRMVNDLLRELLGTRVIALNHQVEWSLRSLDLSLLHFFTRDYLKSKMYDIPLADLDELEGQIRSEVNTLRKNRGMLRVFIARSGEHVEDQQTGVKNKFRCS